MSFASLASALVLLTLAAGCASAPASERGAPSTAAAAVSSEATAPSPSAARADLEPLPPAPEVLAAAVKQLVHARTRPMVDPPMLTGDDAFVLLVSGADGSIDLLIDALTDSRPTQVTSMTGQVMTVSDLARWALDAIVPSLDMGFDELVGDTPRRRECGECAVFELLAQPGQREALQKRVQVWLRAHRRELVWTPIPDYPGRGQLHLPSASR